MPAAEKKLSMELVACATALRDLNLSSSIDEIRSLIAEGYRHLYELRAMPKCNPIHVASLAARIDRAELLLEQKVKMH